MSIQTDDLAPRRPAADRSPLDARVVSGVPGSPAEEAVERALRPKALAEYVGFHTAGLSRLLDALGERGLVSRTRDPNDRRRQSVALGA